MKKLPEGPDPGLSNVDGGVLVISDKYLRSEHCMYELVKIDEYQEFRERIFPIALEDARIYKSYERLQYIRYWDDEINRLNEAIKQVDVVANLQGFTDDLNERGAKATSLSYARSFAVGRAFCVFCSCAN